MILFQRKTKPFESAVFTTFTLYFLCEPSSNILHNINNVLKLCGLILVMLHYVLCAVMRGNT